MCLLITGKSSQIRATLLDTHGLLEDIFGSNADGLGAMYTTSKQVLRTPKILPKNLAECRAFIAQLPQDDRNLALHWRMKTHGDIDLTNCHPYPVIEGEIAMMHNGILSQGNKADPSKSDTWHYIKDVVRPMVEVAPLLFMNRAWQKLIEDDIGNNRFAIMDSAGNLAVLNRDQGVEHEGMWFSNTYAWDPSILIPTYKKSWKMPKHWSYLVDDEDDWSKYYKGNVVAHGAVVADSLDTDEYDDEPADPETWNDLAWDCITSSDVSDLADMLDRRPTATLRAIMDTCEFTPMLGGHVPNKLEQEILDLLVEGNVIALGAKLYNAGTSATAKRMAEMMCWYGEWAGRAIEKSTENLTFTDDEVKEAIEDFVAAQKAGLITDPDEQTVLALTAGSACSSDYAG